MVRASGSWAWAFAEGARASAQTASPATTTAWRPWWKWTLERRGLILASASEGGNGALGTVIGDDGRATARWARGTGPAADGGPWRDDRRGPNEISRVHALGLDLAHVECVAEGELNPSFGGREGQLLGLL